MTHVCGADATARTPCHVCSNDLCPRHQIDVPSNGLRDGDYAEILVEGGVYCKDCLVKALINT